MQHLTKSTAAESSDQVVPPQVGRRKLFVVEDERVIALDLCREIEALGYAVVGSAASSDEALLKMEQTRPELVLMDIRLKGQPDGIATASLLRERYRIPVVYLTANADLATVSRALETEPAGYLAKPFDQRSLSTTIAIALRRHDADVALREAQREERRCFQQSTQELNALVMRLRQEASRDPLTGLYGRRHLETTIDVQLQLAERDSVAVSFVLLDVDRFKLLNERYGHIAGDAVLRSLADFLRAQLRAHDIACRYGGKRIALVLPGSQLRDSAQLAERLRRGIAGLAQHIEGWDVMITASFGISAFPDHGVTPEALIGAADWAVGAAKRKGRNCVVAAPL